VLPKFSIGTLPHLRYSNEARAAMKWSSVWCATVLAAQLAGQDRTGADRLAAGSSAPIRPPVLQGAEPSDSMVLTLPGAAAARQVAATPVKSAPTQAPEENDHRPLLRRAAKPVLPAEFERDSALFTQKLIGLWSEPDAYNLFGDPLRDRAAVDEQDVENGHIFAFADPTGRYREVELDFAKETGLLRTVFAYPWKMTWQDCRRIWGTNVQSTEANGGRIFHSYLNRHVDVLVDRAGNVISVGLY
jgi:hypothetical protein